MELDKRDLDNKLKKADLDKQQAVIQNEANIQIVSNQLRSMQHEATSKD